MPRGKRTKSEGKKEKGFKFDVPEDDVMNLMQDDDYADDLPASRKAKKVVPKKTPKKKLSKEEAALEAALEQAMNEAADDISENDEDVVAEEGPGLPEDLLAALGHEIERKDEKEMLRKAQEAAAARERKIMKKKLRDERKAYSNAYSSAKRVGHFQIVTQDAIDERSQHGIAPGVTDFLNRTLRGPQIARVPAHLAGKGSTKGALSAIGVTKANRKQVRAIKRNYERLI